MLSQTVEYALRAAVYLADQAPTARTTEQIAAATRVPPAYLSKVLQNLARGRIVTSQRGLHGGFLLARKPDEITILEVVNAVDPIHRIKTCPLELAAHGVRLCPLHKRVDNALALVEARGIPVLRTWQRGTARLRWRADRLDVRGFLDVEERPTSVGTSLSSVPPLLFASVGPAWRQGIVACLAFALGLLIVRLGIETRGKPLPI